MALITRCPSCATLFKVVPDQLRISGGWVRCGQCKQVFDANKNLQADEAIAVNGLTGEAMLSPLRTDTPAPEAAAPGTRRATEQEMSEFRALFDQIASKPAVSAPMPVETLPDTPAPAAAQEPVPVMASLLMQPTATPDEHDGQADDSAEVLSEDTQGAPEDDEAAKVVAEDAVAPQESAQPGGDSLAPNTPAAACTEAAELVLSGEAADAEAQPPVAETPDSQDAAPDEAKEASAEAAASPPPASPACSGTVDFLLSGIGTYATEPPPAASEPGEGGGQPVQPALFRPSVPYAPLDLPDVGKPPRQATAAAERPASSARRRVRPAEEGQAVRSPAVSAPSNKEQKKKPRSRPAAEPPVSLPPGIYEEDTEADELSFVRQARRRAMWRRPGMRLALFMALTALALALLGQMALHHRSWLAARVPAARGALQLLCQPLGCTVEPYRLLDAVVIDSSGFVRTGGNTFSLSFGLRNTADLPVATPSLELTLSNAEGKTVLRRVLPPAEQGGPDEMAARSEFASTVALTVDESAQPASIMGYRLTAFYP
ncbi:MAG: DUF3426 domain-containing protein [Ottowia sp.]